jgi:proline iminopeptidase
VEEADVTNGDVTLHVRSYGGPGHDALVVLHGGPGMSTDYLEPLSALASPSLRVVLYDQRDVGASSRIAPGPNGKLDPAAFAIASYVSDLHAVIGSLGAGTKVHLMGHSWGGIVAQAYAAEHASELASLTLLSSPPPTRAGMEAGGERFHARVEELTRAGAIPSEMPKSTREKCATVEALLPAYFADPEEAKGRDLGTTRCTKGVNGATMSAIGDYDFRPALAKVELPVTVMMGDKDPFGIAWLDETASAFSHAKLRRVVLAGHGHLPWAEPNADGFFAEVRTAIGE